MAETPPPGCPWPRSPQKTGLTLTELLIGAALSLFLIGAVASLFSLFGRSVKQSQTTMHLSGLLRSAAWQLRQDLAGVTCQPTPWLAPETNAGYFELIEGPDRDTSEALDSQGQPTDALTADTDDILLFTTQSLAGDFVGRYDGKTVESPYAEVAWFCRPSQTQPVDGTTLYDLHRRQLLVMNYLGRADLTNNALPRETDRAKCDISLRPASISGQGLVLLPNSLGDLTKREHRFMRGGYWYLADEGTVRSVAAQAFPFAFPLDSATGNVIPEAALDSTKRAWEDVVLTDVVGFDVRVFDPKASVMAATDAPARTPGDPGYATGGAATPGGFGAYVDLGWGGGVPVIRTATFPPAGTSAFQSAGMAVTDLPRRVVLPSATYDTWSRHYEFNGVDDDGDGVVDEGVNGVTSSTSGWPEQTGALETSPPYPVPLRGLEVRIRCYEPASRQVRQVTIRHSFAR